MSATVMQGHDRRGWDTETCMSMEDARACPDHARTGDVAVCTGRGSFVLPRGIGRRYEA